MACSAPVLTPKRRRRNSRLRTAAFVIDFLLMRGAVLNLSRPINAKNPIFGDERNEQEVRRWYRHNDHCQPSCLLGFHAATSPEVSDQRRIKGALFRLQGFRERTLTFPKLRFVRELLQSGHGACGVVYTLRRLWASVGFRGGIVLRHWLLPLRFTWQILI